MCIRDRPAAPSFAPGAHAPRRALLRPGSPELVEDLLEAFLLAAPSVDELGVLALLPGAAAPGPR
eukprot:6388062-Alexandrium_andersonii.AAC.1